MHTAAALDGVDGTPDAGVLGAMAVGGGMGVVDNRVTPALWYGGLIGFAVWPLPVAIALIVRAVRESRAS